VIGGRAYEARGTAASAVTQRLNNYLACEHRTALDHARVRGEITLRKAPRPDAQLIAEKGLLHEHSFLESLRDAGRDVLAIAANGGVDGAAQQTLEAMHRPMSPAIAERVFLAPKSVRNATSSIYSKLGVADRVQAVVRAREAGL
jgi:hypothetical protein